MGALDAFYSTWSDARETFGQGTPQDGSKLDNSSQLMQMKAGVEAAAPDGRWQGPASEAYGAKNKEHAGVYGKLAELDTKMATEVTNASNVVTAGRQSLDITKSWVDSAVKALPSGLSASDRDAKLLSIANEGIGKVSTIVTEATNKMTDINGRVQGIKGQWHALGNEFGEPKIDGLFTDEESAAFARAKAESDVHKALAGDKKSAAEVARILDSISEEQKRTGRPPLTPQQGSYLSQMQAQQNGMSVDALKRAKDNLKEQGHIIGDSWQLMSNPKLEFPKTKLEQYELDNPNEKLSGGYEQLPRQVKEAIDSFAWTGKDEISDIANIVENGADRFQTNTDLDRALIQKADDWMNTREWTHARAGEDRYDSPVGAVLAAVSPDHQVVHDMITGANGAGGSKFVDNIAQHYWTDDGKSAASLFSWTEAAAAGPESQIAAETAHAYATYVGEGAPKLADLMEPSPGKANPALVQGIAHGLSPYIENLAGQSNEYSQWFPAPADR
ncbi:TPR repeat region-containing protein [Mycolicibacterium mageritense]|uniref:TPR repeat region-containing protein n=1 Tax=Mycolicibacterium mageritense TaxID=53462 RepID=UPI001E3399ED|nr:EspA/EspE family type VII secretion system effector [Mycolicibacterium mageritense]GJJ19612.1 hypothetical protein MTY414_32850 [Mycolicibacterium mageritense]